MVITKSTSAWRRALALPLLGAAAASGSCGPGAGRMPEAPPPPQAADPPRLVEVIATEYDFNPGRILAEPGESLILSLRNEGRRPHSIALELPAGVARPDAPAAPLGTARLRIQAPAAPGEYVVFCPIGNHRDLGMRATLTVRHAPRVGLRQVAAGLTSPVAMAVPPDGSRRRFVVDQVGLIWILGPDGALAREPFLDLRNRLVPLDPEYDERGLLGLAFHPDFARNGRFFVYYTAPLRPGGPAGWDHTNRLSELRLREGQPDRGDPGSEKIVMQIDHPQMNHDGGTILFGPKDGYLYVSLGDGGAAADKGLGHTPALGNAQDPTKLHGSILRIDVDHGDPYCIPPDNPFVGQNAAPEIYAYGLRNPYRMSFDMGGDRRLFAGDVGQDLWEEVSIIEKGGNYGWRILEGTHCFNPAAVRQPPRSCARTGASGEPLRWPVIELPHAAQEGGVGSAIVGGHVYRGKAMPALAGRYIFGMWSRSTEHVPRGTLLVADEASARGGDLWPVERLVAPGPEGTLGHYLLGLGQDETGEIYALVSEEHGPTGRTGKVLKLVPPGGR
jgi:glucose/arabinose dehydrogenase